MKKIIYALFTIVVFNLSASAEELEVECDQQKRSLGFLKSATTVAALGAYLYLLRWGELPESLKNVVSKASEFGGMCLSPILTKMIHNPKLTASLIAASGVYGVELAEEVKFWDNKYGVLTKNVNGSALRKNCQQIKNMFDFIISLPWRWVPKCTNEYKEMIKKETWISWVKSYESVKVTPKITSHIFVFLLKRLVNSLKILDLKIISKLDEYLNEHYKGSLFFYPHLIPIFALSTSIYLLLKNAKKE